MYRRDFIVSANANENLPEVGRYIRLDESSATLRFVTIPKREEAILEPGESVKFDHAFDALIIYNETASDATGIYTVGSGEGEKAAPKISGSVDVTAPDTASSPAGSPFTIGTLSSALVSASASTKKKVHISATGTMRFGSTAADAQRGVDIPAGMILAEEISGDVYIYNPTGGNITVRVNELHDNS